MNQVKFKVVYDGHCGFCRKSVAELQWLDSLHKCEFVDYQVCADLTQLHPTLTKELANHQMHLISPDGKIYGGFYAFRRMALFIPLMFPLVVFLYLPFAGRIGSAVYQWVARHRYLFASKNACQDNQCSRS